MDDVIKFSTGRRTLPNGGYVGINHELSVAEGWDSSIRVDDVDTGNSDDDELTAVESVELADEMLKRWAKFRQQHAGAAMPIDLQIQCVARELALRRSTYPKWVTSGRMKQEAMDLEIARMEAVLDTLKGLRGS